MNERIEQLLKQATKNVNPEDREWVFSKVDQTKFAELIVRECAEICLEANDYKNILRHFGVKE